MIFFDFANFVILFYKLQSGNCECRKMALTIVLPIYYVLVRKMYHIYAQKRRHKNKGYPKNCAAINAPNHPVVDIIPLTTKEIFSVFGSETNVCSVALRMCWPIKIAFMISITISIIFMRKAGRESRYALYVENISSPAHSVIASPVQTAVWKKDIRFFGKIFIFPIIHKRPCMSASNTNKSVIMTAVTWMGSSGNDSKNSIPTVYTKVADILVNKHVQ